MYGEARQARHVTCQNSYSSMKKFVGDGVERRRKEGGEQPVTNHSELLLCEEMQRNNGGGWGTFLSDIH